MHYGLLLVMLVGLGIALAVNHTLVVAFSKRHFRLRDYILVGWSVAYPLTLAICFALALVSFSILDDFNNSLANLVGLGAIVILPAACTAAIAAWVWNSVWPAILLIGISPLIAWLVTRSDSPVWMLTAGAVWNAAYASSCAPAALRIRSPIVRRARGGCADCCYDRKGLTPDAPCPECGQPQPA